MLTKVCSKCKMEQPLDNFSKDKNNKDGLQRWCRNCNKIVWKKRYAKNKANSAALTGTEPLEKVCRNCKFLLPKEDFSKDSGSLDGLQDLCKSCAKVTWKEWSKTRDPGVVKENRREYSKERYDTDLQFKLRTRLRGRLYDSIKAEYKSGSAVDDLGCSIPELIVYLESKFQPGMTWENWGTGKGKWNIDHIMPLAAFDLTNRQHLLLACNYLNLQPLWFLENMSKKSSIPVLEFPQTETT